MTINVFGGGDSSGPAFPVQRSVRLRSSNSAYFTRTPATTTSRTTYTISAWVKKSGQGVFQTIMQAYSSTNVVEDIRFQNDNTISFGYFNGSNVYALATTQVFRDPSAWYHVVGVVDSTNATSTERVRLYVNGVRITAFSTAVYPAQNTTMLMNSNIQHLIGANINNGLQYHVDGYLTEFNFIDGQALTPTSFGSYNSNGVWQPVKYSGTYGTNGFYLNFQDNSGATATTIGKDSSGNGNNWTPNGISVTAGVTYDSMLDVPTLTSGSNANFATLNPIDTGGGSVTLSGGNLNYSIASSTGSQVRGTMGTDLTSKWYWEYTAGSAASPSNPQVFGISTVDGQITNNSSVLRLAAVIYTDGSTNYLASKYINGVTTNITSQFRSAAIGDIFQIAYDAATGNLWFGKNNTWYDATNGTTGNPSTGANPVFTLPTGSSMTPFLSNLGATYSGSLNCGQRPFSYTPPTGFKSLNTFNLPDSTIPSGATQFAATTYTGNGSTQSITNTVNGKSFTPDFVWIKGRSQVVNHRLLDSVRGATKELYSDLTNAEATDANGLTAFNSNGFSLGTSTSYNNNTSTYVGWQWKAGGTAVTNTAGSISSQVSANPSAGFSIVTYTGTGANATVGHGLGIAPKFIMIKGRNTAYNWAAWHGSFTGLQRIFPNTTGAVASNATYWNSTTPTSSVFSLGSEATANDNLATFVAYCFSEIAGFSKFGSYTGNGSTDGPFVYLGFKPRWVMLKRTDSTGDWFILDTSRDTYNVAGNVLYPNLSSVESGVVWFNDILSNGFKLRITGANQNASGGTYIYAAFSENPFKNSLAR